MTQPRMAERLDEGRSLRARPHAGWGEWSPVADRNPVARLEKQHISRVSDLVPIRRGRVAGGFAVPAFIAVRRR